MTALTQSADVFRAERQDGWLRFEALLDRVERRSLRTLDADELMELPLLYRATLSSLSVARATSLDKALVDYLEGLSLRGYLQIYGVREGLGHRVRRFFAHDWPAAVRDLWAETVVAVALLVLGAVAGYALVAADPDWFGAIVPGDLSGERRPGASAEVLRQTLYDEDGSGAQFSFATMLFVHNTQVSILVFALGFAFGLPSILLLLMNGALLGAFLHLFGQAGLLGELGGWLAIHGTTELFAIAIAGAAGLRIGTRVAFPGRRSRTAAAASAGRSAATAMLGVALMLILAGLLEGIGRQAITDGATRYTIGLTLLAGWILYFYRPGRSRGAR